MSFANTQYVIYAIIAIAVITILLNRLNARYFKWVKSYWFYERTWTNRFASFLYLLSLFLFMISLLDLRGPEKRVKANLPDQRTIILLDTSSSMLAEDVRPNRFIKSLQIARHFVKNAPGHQISIVLFSDIQKRLIPFTDDVDLIDSRLAALEKTNAVSGGSNISQAIAETVGYFESDSKDEDAGGNILVFTDAEESEGAFSASIPSNINVALVGVGTLKGANIPLRYDGGDFRGYKTFKGEPVVTKLDEDYIKKIGKNAKSFKYWIANSYSLPTEEIMNFFRASYKKKQNTGDVRIRPVYSHYILIPAIILYCLSVLIGRFAVFKTVKNILIITLCATAFSRGYAQEKEEKLPPEIVKDMEKIKEGSADRKFTLKVAEKLLRTKEAAKAKELYSEYAKADDEEEVKFNYATSMLKSGNLKGAKPIYKELLKNSSNEELKKKIRSNLSLSLKQQEKQKQEQNKDQKQNKDQQDQNKDDKQSSSGQSKDNKKNDQKNDQNKDGKDKNQGKEDQKKDGKDKQSNQEKQDGQKKPDNGKLGEERDNKENKDSKKDKEKEKDKNKGQGEEKNEEEQKPQGPQSLEEKEKEIQQKRKMVKTPAMIKQILSDDRDLQKRMMDTSTNLRGDQKPKRDW